MIASYPKIWNLGHPHIAELFFDEVRVEEKVDGSQFSFGVLNGELVCRSKGVQLNLDEPEKMFAKAVETARELEPRLQAGWVYRGEYLQKPHHNALAYDRVPMRHIVLFDIMIGEESYLNRNSLVEEGERLGLEIVPEVFRGKVEDAAQFEKLMDRVSFLGGAKIEGLVIKNHTRFGKDGKSLLGKFVSSEFREIHAGEWKKANPTSSDIRQILAGKFCTEARWHKAVQHLAERGELLNDPKDIGPLMRETHKDIETECVEQIAQELLKWAMPELKRTACRGLSEWYKQQLVKKQFEGQ